MKNPMRWPAAAFVLGQAFLLWLLRYDTSWVVALAPVLLVLGVLRRDRFALSRFAHGCVLSVVALTLLAIRLGAMWRHADINQLFALFAEYLLLVQCLEFWRMPRTSSNNYLPGLGCLTVASLILSLNATMQASTLQWIFLLFVILLAFALRPDLPGLFTSGKKPEFRKAITLLMIFAGTISCGTLFQQQLRNDLPELQKQFSMFNVAAAESVFAGNAARFVESVTMESVTAAQLANPEGILFTVDAAKPPGYMRTISFQHFDGWRWQPWKSTTVRSPGMKFLQSQTIRRNSANPEDASVVENGRWYELATPAGRQPSPTKVSGPTAINNRYVVRVPPDRGKVIPLPWNADYLLARLLTRRMALDRHNVLMPGLIDTTAYVVYANGNSAVQSTIDPNYARALLELPAVDRNLVTKLAAEIMADQPTIQRKIAAVESYFRDNYEYSLNSDFSGQQGRSPLRIFLEDRPDSHCEFFATATTLLLRAQGIPCRMSTGYLTYELNDEEDYYVAANRNAHAWAEAWNEETRTWQIVESTPGISNYVRQFDGATNTVDEQIEVAETTTTNRGFWSDLSLRLSVWISAATSSRWLWLIAATASIGAIYLAGARRNSISPAGYSPYPGTRHLRTADRYAAKRGFQRRPNETAHQFARRLNADSSLQSLVEWYQDYGTQRYQSRVAVIAPPPRPPRRA